MAPKKEIEVVSSVVAKRGRGRPPKLVAGESSNASAKRGRGRPPKLGRGDGGGERGRSRGPSSGGNVAVAAVEANRSPSPARSESPFFGSWDEFPISEFILTLYESIQRIQWLTRAVADALEGEGPFRFLLHRVGARQGPWEVLARVITSQEGEEVRRRAEFFSGWKAFAKFFRLAPPFIVRFQLKRQLQGFYVKVFDGSLCLKQWEERDDHMTPPPA